MIKIIKAKDYKYVTGIYSKPADNLKILKTVQEILDEVKKDGDSAVIKYSKRFDKMAYIKVINREEMKTAYESADKKFVKSLEKCAKNITEYHKNQIQTGFEINKDGKIIGQKVRPLHRVGIYVPGGTAAYPSSVLMNAIPAHLAKVPEIVMITPPKDGDINPDILTAAYIAHVDEIILIGGAQSIAALAYGTETIRPVDKIVGPGNIYVTMAKKLVSDIIDADITAGPSEILIVADESANSKFIAADMLSQAEHDELAKSILITTFDKMAKEVSHEIEKQIKNLERAKIARESIDKYGLIILCENIKQMIELANEIAPEHLEILLNNPMSYINKFDNAGSVFLGNYSPEALGDYYAGPNHVLPTAGTARFSSPLSVESFLKKYSYIYYAKDELKKAKDDVVNIAEKEGLTAHANAVKIRFEE